MLLITADIFSGRPNPSWIITDENESRGILRDIATRREIIGLEQPASATLGLGFRGLVVGLSSEDLAKDYGLPSRFLIATRPGDSGGMEMAERLIDLGARTQPFTRFSEPYDLKRETLRSLLLDQMGSRSRVTVTEPNRATGLELGAQIDETGDQNGFSSCSFEMTAYTPGFWNDDAVSLLFNNCYAYASNRKTNSYPQPGRASGVDFPVDNLSCQTVTAAALADGLHRRHLCFPDTEVPRYLVALVVWPNLDYHWYRINSEGFWSHKPGYTPVRNVDNSGNIIRDPVTCDRAGYTEFCGFFYTCRSQRIE
jgi:hypothetical protein